MRALRHTLTVACFLIGLSIAAHADARVVVYHAHGWNHPHAVYHAPVRVVAVRPARYYAPLPYVVRPVRVVAPIYVPPPAVYGGLVIRTPVVRAAIRWH